uniref:N/A n=1 Tax=Ganoderma boninense TaxID=34458 RepID=A0A5K1JTB9_9APHY|nr:N/A [Ganoderma boninense]
MADGFDIWGVVASVLGLVSLFQLIAAVILSRLPQQCLRTFDVTLEETDGLLRSVEEEGLFNDDDGQYMSQAKERLTGLCNRGRRLRGDAFAAQTLSEEIAQWWTGLSKDIAICCKDLKALRAHVSPMQNTSNDRRKALAQSQNNLVPGVGAQPDSTSTAERTCDSSSMAPAGPCKEDADVQALPLNGADETVSTIVAEPVPIITAPSEGTQGTPRCLPEYADTPPSYRRQSSLPPYTLSNPLSATIFTRYSVTSSDTRRAMRKLARAQRRNLMVQPSAMAADRPSNAARHWKFLEARSKSRLLAYVTASSQEATLVPSPHVAGTAVI